MRENIAKNLCKVIALANQKGGVAKSFTTASLAVGLVNSGNRVLVIDNDPQGHASRCLGVLYGFPIFQFLNQRKIS